jgi:hypothetical protein
MNRRQGGDVEQTASKTCATTTTVKGEDNGARSLVDDMSESELERKSEIVGCGIFEPEGLEVGLLFLEHDLLGHLTQNYVMLSRAKSACKQSRQSRPANSQPTTSFPGSS